MMGMELRLAVAKAPRFGVSESGDAVEVVERPRGGLSVVVVDGQGSGRAAKRVSHQVVNKAAGLIGDGARDGAVVRAVHDFLYASREGKVSATLTLISVDLDDRSLVVSRNTNTPILIRRPGDVHVLEQTDVPIGVHRMIRPDVVRFPIEPGLVAIALTDGVVHAGRRTEGEFAIGRVLEILEERGVHDLPALADELLAYAVACDGGKPADDMALVVLAVLAGGGDTVRRLALTYPFWIR